MYLSTFNHVKIIITLIKRPMTSNFFELNMFFSIYSVVVILG